MTDKGPEIRDLARRNLVRYTKHAIERINQYKLSIMQVQQMLKNCSHDQSLDDKNGYRVQGRAANSDSQGVRKISAHVNIKEKVIVITVIDA